MTTTLPKIRRPKKKTFGEPIYIRLEPEEAQRVETHAANDCRNRSSFLRIIYTLGIAAYERGERPFKTISSQ